MKKYISWNVNGIRACVAKWFLSYLENESPDIIWLQEVKAMEDQNPIQIELLSMGYHIYWNSAIKKGYSWTAIFTKELPISVWYGMVIPEHDMEWRIITCEYEDYYFVTVYTPNSKNDLSRLSYRCQWDKDFLLFLAWLEQKKPVIFCGDLNVAHNEIDLANPRANKWEHGFTDEERFWFQNFMNHGFHDSFRSLFPEKDKSYTWWSNFWNSRERNVWWRIDYFLISDSLRSFLVDSLIYPEVIWSDHCPIGITLNI